MLNTKQYCNTKVTILMHARILITVRTDPAACRGLSGN